MSQPGVIAVSASTKKGVSKTGIARGVFRKGYGLVGDAHAGSSTHRQVSLLALESIARMNESGFDLKPGDFAENITTRGINLAALPVGTILSIGENVVMEVTQIGKECHTACAIRRKVGDCVMPTEGIFARVVKGGAVTPGDRIKL
jgi:MOSC domain-containing protein YiiM